MFYFGDEKGYSKWVEMDRRAFEVRGEDIVRIGL